MGFKTTLNIKFFIIICTFILSVISPNPALVLFSFLILAFLFKIISTNPAQPGILIFIFLYHWLQIAATPFAAWVGGFTINEMSWSLYGESTVWLCLIGLLFLALGYSFWLKKLKFPTFNELKQEALLIPFNKIVAGYIIFFFLSIFIKSIAFIVPAATQPLIRVAEIKNVFIYILIFVSLLTQKHQRVLLIIVGLEFIMGFIGYFSGFKNIIFYIVIATIPLIQRIKFSNVLIAGFMASIMFLLALSWQAIKGEYRSFLNQGTSSQTVRVDAITALKKVQELFGNLDSETRNEASFALLDRVAYTKFIANAVEYVPEYKPHQNGNLWLSNATFALVPRFLNPNKGIKDDSQKVMEYTSLRVATRQEGASISLGYFGDCYIDFGYWGMMPFLTFLGWLIGASFYYLYNQLKSLYLFKYAYLNVVFYSFYSFEADGAVVIGVLVLNTVYYLIIIKVIMTPITRLLTPKLKIQYAS